MSEPGRSWLDEAGEDLARDPERPPAFGPFGLLALAVVLAGALSLVRDTAEDMLLEFHDTEAQDEAGRRARELQEALDEKAAGRYRVCWRKLRKIHDARPADAAVNMELASYHSEVGNRDFAVEYLVLVEGVRPDWPRARLLRGQLLLARAADAHRDATKPGTARGRALELLGTAAADIQEARDRLPDGASEEVPGPARTKLLRDLSRQDALVQLKRAELLTAGGGVPARREARDLLKKLLARYDLDDDVRRRVKTGLDALTVRAPEWRSGR